MDSIVEVWGMIEGYLVSNGHHWDIIFWDLAQRGFFWQVTCTHVDYQLCLRLNLAHTPSLLLPLTSSTRIRFSHFQSHNDTNLQLTMHQWRIQRIEAVPLLIH